MITILNSGEIVRMHFSILLLFVGVVVATTEDHFLSDNFINKINSKQTTWTAGRNFDKDYPESRIRALLGVKKEYKTSIPVKNVKIQDDLPENFDAREQWPECKSIKQIRDQGSCGSCWAVAAASAMSDRICIKTNGGSQVSISINDLLACCWGDGCNGGSPENAWIYYSTDGICSGGEYGSNEGCQTYSIPSCEHHNTPGSRPPCGESQPTPACTWRCDANSTLNYNTDLHFGDDYYSLPSSVEGIKTNIKEHGPVEATLAVYEDFVSYKNGVYQHTAGELLGYHAVRIIGWGVENEVPYWLATNSWNEDWGDKGLFKIRAGTDECEIEDGMVAGTPFAAVSNRFQRKRLMSKYRRNNIEQ